MSILLKSSTLSQQQGFTLLEVLVALLVAALAFVSVSQVMGESFFRAQGQQARVGASWAAMNQLVASKYIQGSLEAKQTTQMLNRTWETRIEPLDSGFPGVQMIQVVAGPPGFKTPTLRLVGLKNVGG